MSKLFETSKAQAFAGGGLCGQLIHEMDWRSRKLGPVADWPTSLRVTVSLCLNSRFPTAIYWGDTFEFIYNDAFAPILGIKHPSAMGRSGPEVWPEIWNELAPRFREVLACGERIWQEDQLLELHRHGFTEECYFTFSESPIRDENGQVRGIYISIIETTVKVIGERRASTLHELAAIHGSSEAEVIGNAFRVLRKNPGCLRFAELYRVDADGESAHAFLASADLPPRILLAPSDDAQPYPDEILPRIRAAFRTGKAERARLHDQPVYLLPLFVANEVSPSALLILGLSARLPLNEAYLNFLHSVQSVIGHFLGHARARELAQTERARLEGLFMSAPGNIAILTLRGDELFYDLTNPPYNRAIRHPEGVAGKSLREVVPHFEGLNPDLYRDLYRVAREGKRFEYREQRVKLDWLQTGEVSERYLNFVYEPVFDAHGKPHGVMSFTYDVTDQVLGLQRLGTELEARDRYFRTMVDASPAVLWVTDADGFCNYLSQRWYDMTGQTPATGLGFGWLSATHPEDAEAAGIEFRHANAEKRRFYVEYRVKQADGRYRWAIDVGNPHWDAEGKYLGMVGMVVDIHDRRDALAELEHFRERFARVLRSTEVGVWYCDLPFDELIWDARTREHFWLTRDEIVTIDVFYARIHPDDREPTREAIAASITDRVPYDIDYRTVDPESGAIRWVRAVGTTTYDSAGRPIRFDGITTDITQRKQIETALAEAVTVRDEFLSIASHELKTPITSLKIQLQLTERAINVEQNITPPADTLARSVGMATRQVNRLTKLIDELLDVSRIGAGKLDYQFEPMDLGVLAAEVLERLSDQFRSANTSLEFAAEPAVLVRGDRTRLDQVLVNLLTNAIKYGAGRPIRVQVSKEPSAGFGKVEVIDHGMGVPKEMHSRIFERFERAIPHTNISGLGLGLYICREIVLAHGGEITVSSVVGEGSTFTFRIPGAY